MIFVNRGTDDSVEMGVEPKPLSPDLGRASVGSSIFSCASFYGGVFL